MKEEEESDDSNEKEIPPDNCQDDNDTTQDALACEDMKVGSTDDLSHPHCKPPVTIWSFS